MGTVMEALLFQLPLGAFIFVTVPAECLWKGKKQDAYGEGTSRALETISQPCQMCRWGNSTSLFWVKMFRLQPPVLDASKCLMGQVWLDSFCRSIEGLWLPWPHKFPLLKEAAGPANRVLL